MKSTHLAAHALPVSLRGDLYDFKLHGNEKGYFLIRSLPCDENLMDTPRHLQEVAHKKETFYSEFWLSAIGSLLGEPFSYIQENHGNLFHNVRPDPQKSDKLSSESSKKALDLHSETAFHPMYPHYLLLFCLRGDRKREAKTFIASLASIRDRITPKLDQILRQPLFKTGVDYSFGNENGLKGNGTIIPILYGDAADPLIIFDPDLMEGITKEATQAIQQLKEILDTKKQEILLERGDLLIVDNYRALHGRNHFTPNYDGKDRWLQRVYITHSLLAANKSFGKKERIITHAFSNDPHTARVTQVFSYQSTTTHWVK